MDNPPKPKSHRFFFALFHIYCNVFASISELWLSAIHFGGFCAICALMSNENEELDSKSIKYWINIALAGIAILTTSNGILSDREARAQKVGGEVLCEVW